MTELENPRSSVHPDWPFFHLPPFSPVAVQVMQLVKRENVPIDELSMLIATDQAFVGSVLTLANSALYGQRTPITDISHAINRLGTSLIQGLCVNVAVVTFLGKSLQQPVMRNLWSHNLACGFISEILAAGADLDAGIAFTAGLLHDIGRLALGVLRPDEYVLLLNTFQGSPSSFLASERELFGFDHCEAGRELVRGWMLPETFSAVVATHHHLRSKNDPLDLAGLVNVSCRIADTAGFGALPHGTNIPYSELLDELPIRSTHAISADIASLSTEIGGRIALMLSF